MVTSRGASAFADAKNGPMRAISSSRRVRPRLSRATVRLVATLDAIAVFERLREFGDGLRRRTARSSPA